MYVQRNAQIAELARVAEASRRRRIHRRVANLVERLAGGPRANLEVRAQPVGDERAGQQVVDRDVVAHDASREPGDEAGQPRARAVGEAEDVDRRLDGARRDVDDAAELALDHRVDRRLDQLDRRQHVRVERTQPRVAIPVTKVAWRRAARVVDEDVRLRTCGERLCAAAGCRDVASDPRDIASGQRTDLRRRLLDVRRGSRADRDVDTFAGQRLGASPAEPFAGPANQRAPTGEAEIHRRVRPRAPPRRGAPG